MSPAFERVAVLGLGLVGGSVALAAKSRGAAARVAGATRRREVLAEALRRGAVDEVGAFDEVVRDADLVVLATPLFAMAEVVGGIAPRLREGALVTDVGSVKAPLVDTLPGLLPRGVRYVGAHPMAGSHRRGFEHARADLFEGAPCVVTAAADARAEERVCDFWRSLGARVVRREPAVHDAEVAWMSHVPHVMAFAFAKALGAAPRGAYEVSGSGFRDFTRIAQSDPGLWGDILTANRKAIAAPLQAAAKALADLGRAIEANEAREVERWIATGRATLSLAPSQRSGRRSEAMREARSEVENPETKADSEETAGEGARTTTDG